MVFVLKFIKSYDVKKINCKVYTTIVTKTEFKKLHKFLLDYFQCVCCNTQPFSNLWLLTLGKFPKPSTSNLLDSLNESQGTLNRHLGPDRTVNNRDSGHKNGDGTSRHRYASTDFNTGKGATPLYLIKEKKYGRGFQDVS